MKSNFLICISVPLIKSNVGWFLLKRFVDLVIVRFLHMISRSHSNTLLLMDVQKTKSCPKYTTAARAISSDIKILTV